MAEESDIWRAAGMLVDQRGEASLALAGRQARELERQGDYVGAATWRRIRDAVEALLAVAKAG